MADKRAEDQADGDEILARKNTEKVTAANQNIQDVNVEMRAMQRTEKAGEVDQKIQEDSEEITNLQD